jgi:hypothetical protein
MQDTKPPRDDPAQSQRFIDMALEVGVADDAAVFDSLVRKVTELPTQPSMTKRKPRKI